MKTRSILFNLIIASTFLSNNLCAQFQNDTIITPQYENDILCAIFEKEILFHNDLIVSLKGCTNLSSKKTIFRTHLKTQFL